MTEQKISHTTAQDPWPMVGEATLNGTAGNTHFDDNFTQLKDDESNENGLQLPESEHYLAVLGNFLLFYFKLRLTKKFYIVLLVERKLMRIQNKQSGKKDSNKAEIKEILKSLNAKRDALFQHDLPITSDADFDDTALASNESVGKSSQIQAISSLITNTALYGVLEKKIAPQNQALDAEEVKKLLDADLLSLIKESESANANLPPKDVGNSKKDTK